IQPTVRHPERKRGTSPKLMDHTRPLAQPSSAREVPLPKRGVRDDTVWCWGMEIAFSLLRCHPERHEGPHPKLVDHTGWLTQDRLLDVCPISRSDYLCMSLQNRS